MILNPKGIGWFWYVSCETPWEDPFFGDKTLCAETNVSLDIRAYRSYEGAQGEQNSGAYIFRPSNSTPTAENYHQYVNIKIYTSNEFL